MVRPCKSHCFQVTCNLFMHNLGFSHSFWNSEFLRICNPFIMTWRFYCTFDQRTTHHYSHLSRDEVPRRGRVSHLVGALTYCLSCSKTDPTITLPKKTFTTINTKNLVAACLSIIDNETWPSNLLRNIIICGRNVRESFSARPGRNPCNTDLMNFLYKNWRVKVAGLIRIL